jgi:serine/threonine protein kinase/Tol biopolymer transport system component
MTTDRWRFIEALYHEVLARPVHERAEALAAACQGDAELQAEVQSLLDQPATGFLGTPILAAASSLVAAEGLQLTGRQIGVFEVQELLGAGGMGEVYRARDTRLGREVALKIVNRAYKDDPQRLGRFEREARVLASLNHPRIGAIYGLEEADGVKALVMELVEGEDLSRCIARGAIPLADALMIARQIAEAVEAAHEQGIIHRDLKPANIKVRQDGTVKVLDFGLAKAVVPVSDDHPRIDGMSTEIGVIMGTSAYMSPEQARGEPAGRQSDIWSFGVVLYELLTGSSPFVRPTTVETLARVLSTEPDFSVLPATTPATVRHLIRRCLERDTKRRLQHMGDVRIELEDALAALTRGATAELPEAVTANRRSWRIAGVVAIAALAGGAAWFVSTRSAPQIPAAVTRLTIPSPEPPSNQPYGVYRTAISEDGSRVAYVSANRIWIRRMDQPNPVAIEVGSSWDPFFSPDGEWIGFYGLANGETGLKKVSAFGGRPVLLAATSDRPAGATWEADGTILFATAAGLYRVSENGGDPTLLVKPDPERKERAYAWPHMLPDRQSVIFTIVPEGSIDGAQIAVMDLRTLERRIVLKGGSAARYASTGHLVYASGRVLKAIAFDAKSRQTRGDPVAIADIEIEAAPDNGAAEFAISRTGTLLFVRPSASTSLLRTLSWVDRRGKEEPLALAPGRYAYPRVSPDGARVALDITGANRDIWTWNLERRSLTRLTDGPTEDLLPLWSRDGQRIFFASDRTGNFDVYSQAADGATPARQEFATQGTQMPASITPDGTRLLLIEDFKDVSALALPRPVRLEPFLHSGFNEWNPVVSPDGNWIAYESNESGDNLEIFLRPFPDVSRTREKISLDGGRYPLWGPKGTNELFYIDLNGGMMAASIELTPSLHIGRVTRLFGGQRPHQRASGRPYDISPIDGRFLIVKNVIENSDATIDISVVLNWTEELKRLVSTK